MSGVVAITGGTGFVGGHVVSALVDAGFQVRMLARDPSKVSLESEAVEVVAGALNDKEALERLCQGAVSMVHCAGAISARDRAAFDEVNVTGTRNVVDACVKAGLEKLVLVSSVAAREPALSDYGASNGPAKPWCVRRLTRLFGPSYGRRPSMVRETRGLCRSSAS